MKHNQTIAMARGLLADGRVRDVARMLEPLVEPIPERLPEAFDASQLMVRSLLARVYLLDRGDPVRALTLLKSFEAPSAREPFPDAARAEVALWLGWAHTWPYAPSFDDARALNLLDEAEHLFRNELKATGRLWAALGRAYAYFAIDEVPLMQRVLHDAVALGETVADAQATRWLLDLRTLAAQRRGQYTRALAHADELACNAYAGNDQFALGRAHTYRAVLLDDLGRPPDAIVEAADEAMGLLRRTTTHSGTWLEAAHRAQIRAELRRGRWNTAASLIDTALHALHDVPDDGWLVRVERGRLATNRGHYEQAISCLKAFHEQKRLPHRRLPAALVALAQSVLYERTQHLNEARAAAERALGAAREMGHEGIQLRALLQLTQIHQAHDDADAARRTLHETEAYADHFSVLPVAALRFVVLGEQALLDDTDAEARLYFDQARAAYTLIGDHYHAACVQIRLAEIDRTRHPEQTRTRLLGALETFELLGADADHVHVQTLLNAWPTTTPAPASTLEANVGAALARAALSVDLVAQSWLQAACQLLPDRWLGVYRCDEGQPWSCLCEVGPAPAAPPRMAEPCSARLVADDVLWLRLRGHPGPAFFFGVEIHSEEDPAWETARQRIQPWIPVANLAFDHALLQATRHDDGMLPATEPPLYHLVCGSPAMRELAAQIRRLHASHSPVLITGEPGAGKEAVARAVHAASERHTGPFVRIACAGVADGLTESSLFGRNGNASSGALQAAEGGTLFLDDIGALPLPMQQKLLRVIESGEVLPNDAEQLVRVDVRFMAATCDDLLTTAHDGQFLEALYYRLHVIPLHVPPLRERKEDIPLLVRHFLDDLRVPNAPSPSLTPEALDALLRYDWPGNVRQLRNELERALMFVRSEPIPLIDRTDLSPEIVEVSQDEGPPDLLQRAQDAILQPGHDLDDVLAGTEKVLIERVMAEHDGQVSAAAEALGLTRQGLYKKLKRLSIDASQFHA